MRIRIKLSFILVPLIFFISCKKSFLNLKPRTYLGAFDYPKTEDEAVAAVNGIYPIFQQQLGTLEEMSEMRSDNTCQDYNPTLRSYNSVDREAYDEFIDNASNHYTNYWDIVYNGIYRTNIVLSKINGISFKDTKLQKQLTGECEFARAFFYFNLVRFYGDVPLLTTPVTDVTKAFSIGRTPAVDVYKQILEDVQNAVDSLPLPQDLSPADIGRVTKGAALTLLAKVQMTLKDFPSAIITLNKLLNMGYSLNSNYEDCFNPQTKNNVESIFEIQFSSSIIGQSNGLVLQWVPSGPDAWKYIFGYQGGVDVGYNIPTKDMIAAYEVGDVRKDISVKPGYIDQLGNFIPVPYINKWIYPDPVQFTNNCNFPVYRYADVLLMLAESLNEVSYSTGGNAFSLLNQVRIRAHLSPKTAADIPNQQEFRLAIERERRVELAFEGHRWFDLLRTGRAIDVMTAYGIKEKADPSTPRGPGEQYPPDAFNIAPFRLLYPIPYTEISKNPDVLKQNPGY